MLSKKRILKKRFRSFSTVFSYFLLVGFVVAIILFLFEANLKINKKRNQFQSQIIQLEEQLKELQEKRTNYEQAMSQVQTEDFLEEKIRKQGYKKPGEEVFVVIPKEENNQPKSSEEKNFWQKFLDKVGF